MVPTNPIPRNVRDIAKQAWRFMLTRGLYVGVVGEWQYMIEGRVVTVRHGDAGKTWEVNAASSWG